MALRLHRDNAVDPRLQTLRLRARRFALKGEHRKAALAMREAVALSPDACSYAQLGSLLVRARRPDEALSAYRQSLWLHTRAGNLGRARTVAQLMLALDGNDRPAQRALETRNAA